MIIFLLVTVIIKYFDLSNNRFLIGYMGSGELLHVVAEYIQLIKSKSPHVKYGKYIMRIKMTNIITISFHEFLVCDPVIGDNNKLVSIYFNSSFYFLLILNSMSINVVLKYIETKFFH